MLVDRKATKLGKRFSLKKAFIIQEKKMGRNISAKPHHINKRENWNILCLQAFKLAKRGSPDFVNLLFAGSQSPEKKNSCHIYSMQFLVKSNPEFTSWP